MRVHRSERQKQSVKSYTPGDIVINELDSTLWLTADVSDIETFERLPRQTLLTILASPPNERYVKVLFGTQAGWIDVGDISNAK